MPFLLVHGAADEVVPPWSSTDFRIRLQHGGHDVTVRCLRGVGLNDIIAPENVSQIIVDWVTATFPAAVDA